VPGYVDSTTAGRIIQQYLSKPEGTLPGQPAGRVD